MKNFYRNDDLNLNKILHIMSLSVFLWCISIFSSFATLTSYAQNTRLSLKLSEVSIKEVFQSIEKKSEYVFFYSDAIRSDLDKKVTIKAESKTIDEILNSVLSETGLNYRINDRQVTITRQSVNPTQDKRTLKINGTVVDNEKNPLPGVTVTIQGEKGGAITDVDGNYFIEVPSRNSILEFRFLGFKSQERKVGNDLNINIMMVDEAANLDEVVVTAWATQRKSTMVGSVTALNPKELKGPTSNITTMMAGRVAGVVAYQTSGEPGRDNANFFIRGVTTFGAGKVNPLILINGIESSSNDLARIQPDDIEGFSVLKDASAAALYGSRGANGVILVTTKTGAEGKTKVNVRYETSFSSNTRNFKLTDNISYMKLANEAALTRQINGVRPYSLSKIDKTASGVNPYLYPSNDWMGLMVRDNTVNHRFNINISGGGNKVVYYIAGTANVDNGILKKHSLNDFNSNVKSNNYELRSNVDIKLTSTTTGSVRLHGRFSQYNGPIDGGTAVFNRILTANPVMFPAIYPQSLLPWANHPLFGSAYYSGTTPYGNPYAYALSGYSETNESNFTAQIEVKQDFDFLLKGLKARIMAYTRRYSYFDVKRRNKPFYYSPIAEEETGNVHDLFLLNNGPGQTSEYLSYEPGSKLLNSYNWMEGAITYNRIFANKHDVGAMLVGYLSNYLTGNAESLALSLPSRNISLSGRLNYAYDSKYMFEFNFGYNGSERFDKRNRFGFFPSVGLAWNLAEEDFMVDVKHIFNKLKLRGSYGIVGNDEIGSASDRFFYLSNVKPDAAGYTFGYNFDQGLNGYSMIRYANSDIRWEKAAKGNLALELGLLKSFNLELDFFKEKRSNILMTRANLPSSMGLISNESVQANVGKAESRGFDATLDFQRQLNSDMWLTVRGTFTFAQSELLANEEPNYTGTQKILSKLGHSINQEWGLIAERYFIDEQEVANSPKQNYKEYKAGDIKYRDVNGDGQITDLDKVPIGNPTIPEIVYGFGFSFGYKSFDVSAYFQGQARSSFWIDPAAISPFRRYVNEGDGLGYQTGMLQAIADSHWSEDNRDLYAFFPRLSSESVENNNQKSTWWMRDGSFLRLKTVEIGYNMQSDWLKKCGLHNLRIYLNGLNLLSFSKFKLWDIEMGGNGLGYPIQRVFNIGIMIGI